MLSETIKLCKRIIGWIKTNERDLFLTVVIILVATISFGLGRLSKIREEKTPIIITETPLSTLNVDNGSSPTSYVEPRHTMSGNNSDKIFVASRNGKKYYYAWCESANVIKEQNRIWFATKEDAEKAGYAPAANCKGLK